MKKIIFLLSAIFLLCGCSAKNSEYIKSLQERGFSQAEIHAYIEYAKLNPDLPEGGYIDVTGRTIKDVSRDLGMELSEYIKENALPSNIPSLTSETEAMYTMPVSRKAQTYGMDTSAFLKSLNLPDTISPDTPWGKVLSEVTLGDYVGEGNIENFKKMYDLPDSVNSNTPYGEILNDVDKVKRENRLN